MKYGEELITRFLWVPSITRMNMRVALRHGGNKVMFVIRVVNASDFHGHEGVWRRIRKR